jgi:cell division protein FtsL
MNWLLPIALVLVVAIVMAVVHLVFMRWMARQPGTVAVRTDQSDGMNQ